MTIAQRATWATLQEQIAEYSGREPEEITLDTNLDTVGIDSLDYISIEINMEDALGVDLNLLQQDFKTAGNLLAYIMAEVEESNR